METINKFKGYIKEFKDKEDIVLTLKYFKEKEGDKLDKMLIKIMNEIDDPNYSCVLTANSITAYLNHYFLDTSVKYHQYVKAKKFLEESRNEDKKNNM